MRVPLGATTTGASPAERRPRDYARRPVLACRTSQVVAGFSASGCPSALRHLSDALCRAAAPFEAFGSVAENLDELVILALTNSSLPSGREEIQGATGVAFLSISSVSSFLIATMRSKSLSVVR